MDQTAEFFDDMREQERNHQRNLIIEERRKKESWDNEYGPFMILLWQAWLLFQVIGIIVGVLLLMSG